MRSINNFWIVPALSTLCSAIVFTALVVAIRSRLAPETQAILLGVLRDNLILVVAATLLTLIIVLWTLVAIFQRYVEPTRKIVEEMTIIHSANPSYRIDVGAVKNFDRLATLINEAADRYQSLKISIDDRIRLAGEALEEEKNILASIVSCLSEAVIVCNPSGTILLFNKKTDELLGTTENSVTQGSPPEFIGLGRHIACYLNKTQIGRAFAELAEKTAGGESNPGTCFATLGPSGHFLKVEIVPILVDRNELAGYVLRINAIAQPNIISTSVGSASECRHWPAAPDTADDFILFPTQLQSLLETTRHQVKEKHGLSLDLTMPDQPAWIYADTRHLTPALIFCLDRLSKETGNGSFECQATTERDYFHIDILWAGKPIAENMVAQWNDASLPFENLSGALKLRDIFARHEAEWWSSVHRPSPEKGRLRIIIPSAEPFRARSIEPITLATSRPEFYDFDLLHRPDTSPDLQEQLLSNLTYTVIDTETTGLDPLSDDIIAVGAIRIVNGRLLRHEVFNVLVDPQREVPEKSTRIHGIRTEMLQGQPTIEHVLPQLHRFVGNTVLVGHNVAFDMRMFQVKEYIVPVRFTQPVLDIMFLSAAIHPSQRRHSLEAISERLGIGITGRHTALGDAITAGEILLKCLPILARNNILTLKDAIQASSKTKYAKLSY